VNVQHPNNNCATVTSPLNADASADQLEVLYLDDYLIAVNKPSRLLVHRSNIDFHEADSARDRLYQQIRRDVFPVHRLDKPTSGVLLFALDRSSAATTAAQFKNQLVSKSYLAVVRGYINNSDTINNPVKDRDAPQKPKKQASTQIQPVAQLELPVSVDKKYPTARYSLVRAKPLSGRRHQIRQHMKHIGHPIVGDTSYGKSIHNHFFSDYFSSNRLLLHAESLEIRHPHTGAVLRIQAPQYDKAFNAYSLLASGDGSARRL